MKKIICLIVAALCLGLSVRAKEKLNVLYVGGSPDFNTIGVAAPDSVALSKSVKERTADFTRFLKQHFTKVTAVDGKDYTPAMSADYDVTVFDGRPPVRRPKIEERDENGHITRYERPAYLPDDFDYATVCIAETSEDLGRSIGTKNDWYCLCLNNYALGWKKDHAIFKGPFKVNIVSEMRPTPETAKDYCPLYGYTLPDETEMWKVHEAATQDNGIRIGMVSRPGGYLDSPDTEVISGGECAKSIDAVAIGRHGNFLHWGFAAKPSDMTEPARAALANAIVYIKDFKGQRPIARKLKETIATRKDALSAKYFVSRDCWKAVEKTNEDFYVYRDSLYKAIQAKKAAGEELNSIEKYYEGSGAPRKPKHQTYSEFVKQRQPKLYEVFGEDAEEYARYYDKNTPYFRPDESGYELMIDQEARALGIANNDIRLLDKAVEMLEAGGDDAAVGKTLLERYTLCRFATPAEWKAWLNANRDRMFFTESGGWLWLVNTRDPNVPGNDYSVLKKEKDTADNSAPVKPAGDTDKDNPVAVNAEIVEISDGVKEIVMTLTVHPGFHTYAIVADDDPFIPTEVSVELPEGYEKVGDMLCPQQSPSATATTYYTGTGAFRQRIKGTGAGTVNCKIAYQACDETMCQRPVTKNFELKI
ncbi:MAG: hypothetical protein NC411_07045 [Bacteroides sp.]|nr:hypothetical protein [Bacteroides sp.]